MEELLPLIGLVGVYFLYTHAAEAEPDAATGGDTEREESGGNGDGRTAPSGDGGPIRTADGYEPPDWMDDSSLPRRGEHESFAEWSPHVFTDPGNSREVLWDRGWRPVNDDPERWLGTIQAGRERVVAGVQQTASGRLQFFLKYPPKHLVQRAHEGRCLPKRSNLAPGACELHFYRDPDSFVDGIEKIRELLEP
jgi:hypothetical protein